MAAFVIMAVTPYITPRRSWVGVASAFHVAPQHFVERHGLLVIIALGESVVAIGAGVDADHLTAGTIATTVLALALPGALWWAYFFAHIPLLLGIVAAAAGIHAAIAHPADPAKWPTAVALAGGIALFLSGVAEVRRALAIGSARSRFIAAAGVLATIPLGTRTSAWLHLATVVGVVAVMLVIDARQRAE